MRGIKEVRNLRISIQSFIEIIINALKEIKSPRFFNTERGFQGEFKSALGKILLEQNIFPDEAIIEEEYQKSLKFHGIRQRPDLVIHVPVISSHFNNRKENNYIVFAFKLSGDKNKVMKDLEKLEEMIDKLSYSFGIFININSTNCFLEEYHGPYKHKLHEFCIKQFNGRIKLRYAHFQAGKIIVTDI